jgi:hypothetical protein
MKTRNEILNAGFDSYTTGKMLEALPPEPPTRPVMTEEIRGRLRSLAGQIEAHKTALAELDSQASRRNNQHEQLAVELPRMMATCSPDDDAGIDRIGRERTRLGLLADFLRNYPDRRLAMMRDLSNVLRQLDKVTNELGEPQRNFFDLCNSPVPRAGEALSYIEMKLRQ